MKPLTLMGCAASWVRARRRTPRKPHVASRPKRLSNSYSVPHFSYSLSDCFMGEGWVLPPPTFFYGGGLGRGCLWFGVQPAACALTRFSCRASRETLREAVLRWSTPLVAAFPNTFIASCKALPAFSASVPLSASCALLTALWTWDLTARLRSLRLRLRR